MSEAKNHTPRIAIPMPHSEDRTYSDLAIPQYEDAVRIAGGEPVRIELDLSPDEVRKVVEDCDAVLLPGSRADINPRKYGADRHEKTAAADPNRDATDELLLRDAYHLHKPVLGICYGLQSLNVFRSGSLVQHIESEIKHSAGRTVPNAHTVEVVPGSLLSTIVGSEKTLAVNSSHHQSADEVGEGLRVVARSTEDGVIEALEGTAPRHFVLAVQWHPERSVKDGVEVARSAKAIFHAFISAARAKHAELSSGEPGVRSAKR
jgi:putative glutamine amidotransferase